MLKEFNFINFKSFENEKINTEKLTTLIGNNASGKTNAIEGISILSSLVSGMRISDLLDGDLTGIISGIRGGSISCVRSGKKIFGLGCIIQDCIGSYGDIEINYQVKININEPIFIEEESLTIFPKQNNEVLIFKTIRPKNDRFEIKVEYNNFKKGKNPIEYCNKNSSIINQMEQRISNHDNGTLIEVIESVKNHLDKVIIYDPDPNKMRSYTRVNDVQIKKNAENISSILYRIYSQEKMMKLRKDKDQENNSSNSSDFEELSSIIKKIPENEISDIRFTRTNLGDVIFSLNENYGDGTTNRFDARVLSDGTLRAISIVALLFIIPEDTFLIIEEFDKGLNARKAVDLLNDISKIAEKKQISVLTTTHNTAVLNSYDIQKLKGVSVIYRDKKYGTSIIKRFTSIEDFQTLLFEGGLGDAVQNGKLSHSLIGTDKKKNVSLDWLVDE